MKNLLIYPMAAYVFYVWGLTVFMFLTRVKAMKSGAISPHYFKAHSGTPPPERALIAGRHYDNQFQVPMLFLVTGAFHFAMDKVNTLTLILAWSFVISRCVHSWIHLGRNQIRKRALIFGAGWILILLMWVQLVYFVL